MEFADWLTNTNAAKWQLSRVSVRAALARSRNSVTWEQLVPPAYKKPRFSLCLTRHPHLQQACFLIRKTIVKTSLTGVQLDNMPIPTVRLASGLELPRLAFGTGTALYNSDAAKQVTMALDSGFRFIDGAEVYANEASMGAGIESFLASSGLKRNDIYVLTKVGKEGMKDLQSAIKVELQKLKVDQLDSYLLHLPPRGQDGLPSNVDAWKELEKIKQAGLTKSIGVSNWLASDIQQLLDAGLSVPDINQIEFVSSHISLLELTRSITTHREHSWNHHHISSPSSTHTCTRTKSTQSSSRSRRSTALSL